MALLTLILKIRTSSALGLPSCTRVNENKLDTNSDDYIDSNRIDDRFTNLSNSIKKMNFKANFLNFKASLSFI